MNIKTNAAELIGNTPLLELTHIEKAYGLKGKLYGKLEYFNTTGSVKDRIAKAMIEDAEEKGILKEGSVIIEPTSGNTGIGLASVGTSKGYRVIIVMPDTFSVERRKLIKAYGAEIVLSEGAKGMKGAIAKAEELAKDIPNSFIPQQFDNPANPKAHYETTGPEIWNDLDGKVDIFVSGVGTGGTITGAGKYLKEKNPEIKVVAVEPLSSNVLNGGQAGPHKIQGIGAGFVPNVLDTKVYDEIIDVVNEDALATGADFGKKEGVLVGISAGAAIWAGIQLAKKDENEGKNIVVILPDSGDRYLSTALFGEEQIMNILEQIENNYGELKNLDSFKVDRDRIVYLLDLIKRLLFREYFDVDKSNEELLVEIETILKEEISKVDVDYERISKAFISRLPVIQEKLYKDVKAIYDGDPSCKTYSEVVLSFPGFIGVFDYRVGHELYELNVPIIPRIMAEHAHGETGIDINPGAKIGEYFCIDHGTGIVIGETATVGHHVRMYHGVTLGVRKFNKDEKGALIKGGKRHPDVGNYVTIYANATILGGDTVIEDYAAIPTGALITQSSTERW